VTRQRVNTWIRTSGVFDAVLDFDAVVRDPSNHSILNPLYNSGGEWQAVTAGVWCAYARTDFLHPNVAGYQAIANYFPLDVFAKFKNGVTGFE
jgi:lysophospholipase L1-like esterase